MLQSIKIASSDMTMMELIKEVLLCSILLGYATCLFAFKETIALPTWMDDKYPLLKGKAVQVDPNCPYHPTPEDLPVTHLPDSISNSVDKVKQQLKNMLNETSLPAIAYSVTYKGKTVHSEGLGTKIRDKKTPPDEKTIFRIGSVSKVFAVLVLYQMIDRNMSGLSMDSLVSSICPGFSMQTEYNITVRQLAAQMSGLPREAPCKAATETSSCPSTTKDIVTELKKQKLLHPPWTKPSYSNLAYSLLGNCLVETFASSMTYETYLHENVLIPLNMKNTGFTFTKEVKEQMAVGYNPDGSVALLTNLGYVAPAGQMYSTTQDLDTLAQFFMSDSEDKDANQVLSPTLRNLMQTTVFVNRDGTSGFGTPWEILFHANYTILRKGGNVGGYSALFSFVPELKLSFNVLFSGAADEMSASIGGYSELIPAFVDVLSTLQKPVSYPPDPEVYEGRYTGGNIVIVIETYNKQLVMRQSVAPIAPNTTAPLAYREPLHLQITFSDSVQPCLLGELLASNGEWVYFAPPENGVSPSFTLPGIIGSTEFAFKRTK